MYYRYNINMKNNLNYLLVAAFLSGISYSCYALPLNPVIEKVEASKKLLHDNIIYRVSLGRADDVALLLKQGASIDEVNESGTPLIALAASRLDNEGFSVMRLLIESGADINKTDKRGQNALFYAAKAGNKEVVKYLLAKKINYSATDTSGNDARIAAYQTGHNEIIEILDGFVREQNELNRKRYEEINKHINEYNKVNSDSVQEKIKQTPAPDTANSLANKPTEQDSEDANIKDLVHKTAFASCSATYWKICYTFGQPTEFGSSNLTGISDTQFNYAKKQGGALIDNYQISQDVVKKIVMDSSEKIKNQLIAFVSNEARKDAGVGSMDDMNRRCTVIASSFSNVKDENIYNKQNMINSGDSMGQPHNQQYPYNMQQPQTNNPAQPTGLR